MYTARLEQQFIAYDEAKDVNASILLAVICDKVFELMVEPCNLDKLRTKHVIVW